MLSSRATTVLVAVIAAIWVVNVIAGIALPRYDPSGVNLIFGAVVSGVLVYRRGNGKAAMSDLWVELTRSALWFTAGLTAGIPLGRLICDVHSIAEHAEHMDRKRDR